MALVHESDDDEYQRHEGHHAQLGVAHRVAEFLFNDCRESAGNQRDLPACVVVNFFWRQLRALSLSFPSTKNRAAREPKRDDQQNEYVGDEPSDCKRVSCVAAPLIVAQRECNRSRRCPTQSGN